METYLGKTIKLGIVGMSAVGKGTFIPKLTKALEEAGITNKVYKEETDGELFNVAQYNFNAMYLNQVKRATSIISRDIKAYYEEEKPQVQIFDRMPHEVLFYNKVLLSNVQFKKVKPFLKNMYDVHDEELLYDYVIVLTAQDDVILERLNKRGEKLSEEMTKKYKEINGYYNHSKGLKINAADYYFLDDVTIEMMDQKMEFIVNDIKKAVFDK